MFKPIQYQEDASKDCQYEHFVWNQKLVNDWVEIGGNPGWCKQLIQGFFGMSPREKMDDYCYTLITRKSYQMGGMRFFSRGINKNGYVANYCETEEILMGNLKVVSHIQIRGSVPCYWQQGGAVSPPILSCPLKSSNDVFLKHMNNLQNWYEGKVSIFNLLSESRAGEPSLSEAWRELISQNNLQKSLDYLHVDFHAVTKGSDFSYVNKYIMDYRETQTKMGYNIFKVKLPEANDQHYASKSHPVAFPIELQKGIFRTNCVDCLDRTNAWMTKLGFLAVQDMFKILNTQKQLTTLPLTDLDASHHEESSFMYKFKNIWADNGDYVSKSYTGTGATTSATTRKGQGGLNGLVDHKFKSISR